MFYINLSSYESLSRTLKILSRCVCNRVSAEILFISRSESVHTLAVTLFSWIIYVALFDSRRLTKLRSRLSVNRIEPSIVRTIGKR